jgi:protein involved in polysaccharide export with SLBB domain
LATARQWIGQTALLVTVWLAATLGVRAQTPEQLDAFRSLPPAEQQKLLRELGALPDGVNGEGEPADPAAASPGLELRGTKVAPADPEPRFRGTDTVVVEAALRERPEAAPPRDPNTERSLTEWLARLRDGNPYLLDRSGVLALPGVPPIALAGLDRRQANLRLNSDPALKEFRLTISLLPVDPALRPFGYDLFGGDTASLTPPTDIPVPAEYVVGPGDTLEVLLVGEGGRRYSLAVGRDGAVNFPDLGPIAVAGLRFAEAKDLLEQSVAEQMIGMRASVSMGRLRSIQVFVVGEAERPGSYTVSGLSTITNALFASGGVKPIGSLRGIQLKRGGRTVVTLDLYDLLLKGDTRNDVRLQPGDAIFIPPVGDTVAVDGEVRRPAIYEIRPGTTAAEAVRLAGGLTPEADPRTATLERIDARRNRTVLDIDLGAAADSAVRLQSGDSIRLRPARDSLEGAVALEGHVFRPGRMQYRPGMRLTDLVGSLDELRPLADTHYVLIRRETGPERRVSALSADLAAAFAAPGSATDVPLQARDRVIAFDLATSREQVVVPLIKELERQGGRLEPEAAVTVEGRVKVPGRYPVEPGMTVSDLIRAGGGLDQAAYGGSAELARYQVLAGERRQTAVIDIDLASVLTGDAVADVPLQPFDYLVIRETPEWSGQEAITIVGEVRFPGTYPIRRGETLRSVIERAGGLTDLAFAEGSVFTRRELREREQKQLDVLEERLRRELATLSLQQAQAGQQAASQAIAAGQGLLSDLESTKAFGRLVIELDRLVAADVGSVHDVILRDADELVVPRRTQEVTVIGEVQSATSHLYEAGLTPEAYVVRSGGYTQRADEGRVFVIRANGQVDAGAGTGWFRRSGGRDVRPGDTVVVPLDAQQVRPLTLWTSVTQILYNLAVAVAAVGSFQ